MHILYLYININYNEFYEIFSKTIKNVIFGSKCKKAILFKLINIIKINYVYIS